MKFLSGKVKDSVSNKLHVVVFFIALITGLLVTGWWASHLYDNFRFENKLEKATRNLLLESETDSEWKIKKYDDKTKINTIIQEIAPGESARRYEFERLEKELTTHREWTNHEDECGHERYQDLFELLKNNSSHIRVLQTQEHLIIFVERDAHKFVLSAEFVRT